MNATKTNFCCVRGSWLLSTHGGNGTAAGEGGYPHKFPFGAKRGLGGGCVTVNAVFVQFALCAVYITSAHLMHSTVSTENVLTLDWNRGILGTLTHCDTAVCICSLYFYVNDLKK